ncbi:MAG: HEAT repeat domain-containing protein, partial [Gemmatimonadota bacterium]
VLIRKERAPRSGEAIPDDLGTRGIDSIELEMTPLVPVAEIGGLEPEAIAEVERHRSLVAADPNPETGRGKERQVGWLRVGSATGVERLTLQELALLVEEPEALAQILVQLSDGVSPGGVRRDDALAEKFDEIAQIYERLQPELASRMSRRLAAAVQEMNPEKRRYLLRNKVLPGLLDGKVEGDILKHLPAGEIAKTLQLLLELQTAVPEIVQVAMSKMELSDERRAAVAAALLDPQARESSGDSTERDSGSAGPIAAESADQLLAGNTEDAQDLKEYSAYDLSVNEETTRQLHELAAQISELDGQQERVQCAVSLLRTIVNPDSAHRVLAHMREQVEEVQSRCRYDLLAFWVSGLRDAAIDIEPDVPEVAVEIRQYLAKLCDREFLQELVHVAGSEHGSEADVSAILEALGPLAAEAVLEQLENENDRANRRRLVELLCAQAGTLAAGLASETGADQPWFVTRNVVRIVGHAGPGNEEFVAQYVDSEHPRLVREALQALARIGTEEALSRVTPLLTDADASRAALGEETIWKFPSELAQEAASQFLEHETNMVGNPGLAVRLLNRLSGRPGFVLDPDLKALSRYRLHFWTPGLRKLGATIARLGRER